MNLHGPVQRCGMRESHIHSHHMVSMMAVANFKSQRSTATRRVAGALIGTAFGLGIIIIPCYLDVEY